MGKQQTSKSEESNLSLTSVNRVPTGQDGQNQTTLTELDKLIILNYPDSVEREEAILKNNVSAPHSRQTGDPPAFPFDRLGVSEFPAVKSAKGDLHREELQTRKEQVESLFRDYLSDVQALGIASAVIVGSRVGEKHAYMWNVFSNDFTPEQGLDPRFRVLNSRAYQLQQALAGIMPLRIAHANPSQLEELTNRCRQHRIDTELVAF